MSINRRRLLKSAIAGSSAVALMNESLFATEDAPNPKSNRFLLYIHFGSSCGVANGLLQPLAPNKWPTGFFNSGMEGQAANPFLNMHTQSEGLVFHDYMKFLAPMAKDMCLVEGTSQSLDHNVARLLQMRGSPTASSSPEWAMGVTEFMRTSANLNPMVITAGTKTSSVADVTAVVSPNIANFTSITSDPATIAAGGDPIWNVLKNRFKNPALSSVIADASLNSSATYQLDTLKAGLPQLAKASADIKALTAALAADSTAKVLADLRDKDAVTALNTRDTGFRDSLILAGILAKTGLANGMTINAIADDLHIGGADVATARSASSKWAMIMLFWNWITENKLNNDVMIVIGQEFARSPYNAATQAFTMANGAGQPLLDAKGAPMVDASGKPIILKAPGRDHSLCMGTMFINSGVPSGGRIGFVGSNMTPQATKDAKGTIDATAMPYTSDNIVGSMLLRVYPDLFPTERMVRKHWPTFKEITPITA
ncbi:MAG: hypothetical protein H7249_20895 [Chitinophagaceae bacterium]|nr:hypothetical protein [Oligoflexus sp.]